MSTVSTKPANGKPRELLASVTVRFAGDSGDGMQLTGARFSDACALAGNDIATLPDYPSEIRAPAGTVAGVSGFQLQFGSQDVHTPGDEIDALVAMNPAALVVNRNRVRPGGIIIVNEDAFTQAELDKAGLPADTLASGLLESFSVFKVPMSRLTEAAVEGLGLSSREAGRSKNMFALGLVCWLYDRPLQPTLDFIARKFAKTPAVVSANQKAAQAGYNFGDTKELFPICFTVEQAPVESGTYRMLTGNQAAALGLAAAASLAKTDLVYASYPITPASEILHELSRLKDLGVITFQAEDEIAAAGAAIGASFGGALAATGTSGPGMALKSEMLGLAVISELPLVIVNVQRGGPSTGLPTKTEQSDLLQAINGRHGESPMVVLAASTPGDCFEVTLEACRIAVKYMTPVVVLSDSYLANGAEPWRVPDFDAMAPIEIVHPDDPENFRPYARNELLARPWAVPGTPGLMHRLGGLEKEDVTGQVSHDPANHARMVAIREKKVAGVKMSIPATRWLGPEQGDTLVIGWGSSWGVIRTAVDRLRNQGESVSACHLRQLNPLPEELGEHLKRFRKVLVVEMNNGQLRGLLQARFARTLQGYNKVEGQPLTAREVVDAIRRTMEGDNQ